MERVPTEADVRAFRGLEPFVAMCGEISGVYQNLDVDSVVFQCRSLEETTEMEFWRAIAARSSIAGWVEESVATEPVAMRTFQRLASRKAQEQFSSSEEIRIVWAPGRITVGIGAA